MIHTISIFARYFIWFVVMLLISTQTILAGLLHRSLTVSTIHGSVTVTDPLIIELIESPAMQRLKGLHQYGTRDIVFPHRIAYDRYIHSCGVFYLLYAHGASREEQVAGLLHDISHTVFSHATDPLFMGSHTRGAYQDTIHEQFLAQHGIADILEQYGLHVADISPKNPLFARLEQPAPALCADRIEYNLYSAYMDNLLSMPELDAIRHNLHFNGTDWYFDTHESAKKFALIPLHDTLFMWGSPVSILIDTWVSQLLKRALDLNIINHNDIAYGTDDALWHLLISHPDIIMQTFVAQIYHPHTFFSWCHLSDATATRLYMKFSGVDPLVMTEHGLILLSEMDPEFKSEFDTVKTLVREGYPVILHTTPNAPDSSDELDPRTTCVSCMNMHAHSTSKLLT